ncbi:MAG: hypothetical protein ABIV28_05315 [Longimicrobiales bacterium]
MNRNTLLLIPIVMACSACSKEDGDRVAARTIDPVPPIIQLYGDSATKDTSKANYGGGMLAHISDVEDDENGNVYVLDSEYKKVAVFGPDGKLKRNILGGYGSAPGEFKVPISLNVSSGFVYVYDHALARISVFDTLGKYQKTIGPLPASYKDIRVRGDRVFATPLPALQWNLHELSIDGKLIAKHLAVTDQDKKFSPDGSALYLATGQDGTILLGHMRAGLWFAEAHKWKQYGREFMPNAVAFKTEEDLIHPTQIYGIGTLYNDDVAICYSSLELLPGDKREIRSDGVFVDFFTPKGSYVRSIQLQDGYVPACSTSKDGRSLLIAETEPYPRVRRFGIEQLVAAIK